jgi:hypothetical protein
MSDVKLLNHVIKLNLVDIIKIILRNTTDATKCDLCNTNYLFNADKTTCIKSVEYCKEL